MIPYSKQNINDDDIKSVVDILKSDYLTQGPVTLVEKQINNYVGSKYSVAVINAICPPPSLPCSRCWS